CPFTPGIGVSGFYRSANGGGSWLQPTYQGLTARFCTGPAPCTPTQGPIGTLPHYFDNGLVSDGDPALALRPTPDGHGGFTYANGSRLYYGNLSSNASADRKEFAFAGFENIAVSHTDDLGATWSDPVLVGKQNAALFNDKDAVWADDAQSSPYF